MPSTADASHRERQRKVKKAASGFCFGVGVLDIDEEVSQ